LAFLIANFKARESRYAWREEGTEGIGEEQREEREKVRR
jgi:hypothetical protein